MIFCPLWPVPQPGAAGRSGNSADARRAGYLEREKVRESMETFAFLRISAHWFAFSTICGPVWSNCARAEKYSQSTSGHSLWCASIGNAVRCVISFTGYLQE